MAEKIIADFSGGMNASVAVDKLKDNECLLAENVRFDEQGNLQITGANTLQNTPPLSGSAHSIFLDPILGAVAGAGTNVYLGNNFQSLALSTATNSSSSKMSFGAAPTRIYMDLGSVGYFKDVSLSDLVTVDWAPPQTNTSGGAITTTKIAGTGTATGAGALWSTPNGVTSTTSTGAATVTLSTTTTSSQYLRASNFGFALGTQAIQGISVSISESDQTVGKQASFTVSMLKGGTPVGTSKTRTSGQSQQYGGPTDLWGATWVPGDINAANFGVQIFTNYSAFHSSGGNVLVWDVVVTIYQSDPTLGFGAGTGAAGTLTGTYTWKITFVAAKGEEGDASNATVAVVLSAQQGTLTAIPTGDIRTASRNVYRKGGLLTSYYLVGAIPDNVSSTFSDNQTDIAAITEGVILPGDTLGDEPNTRLGNQAVKYPCFHYDRIFWAVGNQLIWSKPLNGFAYPVDFEIDIGDSKDITGIFSMGGELFIFKPDSIWRLSGTDENSFQLSKTLSPVGTDWPFTAVISGGVATGFYLTGRIIFANSRGLWAFNGYTSNKMTPKLDLWFRQDDRTNISLFGNSGFHPPEIVNSAVTALNQAAANPLFYYLAYAEAGQLTPNAILVLDLERGAISKRPFQAQSLTADPTFGDIYGGDTSGNIYKLDDWNAVDAGGGANVNMDFQDKYRDLGLRGSKFALWGLEFMLATNGQSLTPSVFFDDGTANESLAVISTPAQQPAKVFRKMASASARLCRNFSFRLNYQGAQANSGNVPNIRLVHVKAYFEPRESRARTGES